MTWNLSFHYWVCPDMLVGGPYYTLMLGYHSRPMNDPNQIHFANRIGKLNSRSKTLLLLGIL